MARARVRKGHPTPMAFAMQSRHIFSIFKVIHTGYFANRQGNQKKAPPGNQRGPFCEPLGGPAGTQGVYPGRSWTYGSVKITICQDFFYNLVIFL